MSLIEEVKQRVDIVEVISEYIPLQKAGGNFKALCPFHTEKTPSFVVFPEQQTWHCFGACASGGDVFSFVMKKEGIPFGEALSLLAHRVGLSITSEATSEEAKSQLRRLADLNKLVAEYYHDKLLHAAEAGFVRDYLRRRGISPESIVNFSLGYSLRGRNSLVEYLSALSYELAELVSAGLAIRKESGECRDRFGGRLMFPIRDMKGKVVGWGARTMDDSPPKYLNSPQTLLFDKSSSLYGIERARDSIRHGDLAVIVEGYMDVIMAHQHGFDNVVASLGTSITPKQLGILKKLSKNITLALDADTAGEMATWRGITTAQRSLDYRTTPVLDSRGLVRYEDSLDAEIRIIDLPLGKDPDEVIREEPQRWQHLVENATTVIDYTLSVVTANQDLTQLPVKSAVVSEMIPLIAEIKDPVKRSYYVQKLARLVNIDEQSLLEAMRQRKRYEQSHSSRMKKSGMRDSKSPKEGDISTPGFNKSLEEYCLLLLLHNPGLRNHIEALSLELKYFKRSENRELFKAWCECGGELEVLQTRLDDALRDYLNELMQHDFPPVSEEKLPGALESYIIHLRERWLRGLKMKEELLIAEAQPVGESAPLELNEQLRELHRKMAGRRH